MLNGLSVVQTSPWLGEVLPSVAIPTSWTCLHSATVRPATTRHMSIYNGALEVASRSLASQAPYVRLAIAGLNVDRHNGKHGGRGALRWRTLWHGVTGLTIRISKEVSIIGTNTMGHSQHI
jgi:hypothetical protein